MGKGLYIGTIVVVLLIIISVLVITLKTRKKKKILKEIDNLEKEKNLLINVPVLNELSKVEALVKSNKKLEDRYNGWKLKFEVIENETIQRGNGGCRCHIGSESGRRNGDTPTWKGEGGQRRVRRSGKGLSTCHGNKSFQRTGVPLSGTTLHQSEETDGSYRTL